MFLRVWFVVGVFFCGVYCCMMLENTYEDRLKYKEAHPIRRVFHALIPVVVWPLILVIMVIDNYMVRRYKKQAEAKDEQNGDN